MAVPRLSLTVAAATRLGDRVVNEDAFLVDDGARVFFVADGFGSETGRLAAAAAVRAAHAAVLEGMSAGVTDRLVVDAFDRAHDAVKEAVRDREPAGGTALCLCLAQGDSLLIGNHGDTQAFRLRQGVLERLTFDPSTVLDAPMAHAAPATGADPGFSPALGYDEGYRKGPEIIRSEARAGDVHVLCSDGLWSLLGEGRLLATLGARRPVQSLADALLDRAMEAGSTDNATVVLLRFGSRA